jgi:type I restriction enzyme M protein
MTGRATDPPPPADAAGLEARLGRVYDHLYGNASFRTPAAIAAEVGKLLRTAAFVETAEAHRAFHLEPGRRRALARGELAAARRLAGDIRARYRAMQRAWRLYPGEALRLSDADLAFCCAELEGVRLTGTGRDVFGDAVEVFRTSWAKRHSGQFFTDGRVARLAMALLEFDPRRGDDLVDVCCGTGGFLLAGLDRIRDLVAASGPGRVEAEATRLALRALRGQEVDPEIAGVASASLAGRLGARGAGLVHRGDSLDPGAFRRGALREGRHRCAASNPPFGARIAVKDPEVLRHYDLARGANGRASSRSPDVLLLERNLRMLSPGEGRLAIVVPRQILSGPQARPVREWLLRQARVEAVVDLPAETFQPHTGTKTSLLVLRRRSRPLAHPGAGEDGAVFMSAPRWIGHDRRGRPVFRRGPDGRPTAEVRSDLEEVARAFETWRRGGHPAAIHPESFAVDAREVTGDPGLRLDSRYHRRGGSPFAAAGRWRTVRLGDAVQRVFMPGRFKRAYVDPGPGAVAFLGGADVGRLVPEPQKWLSPGDPRLETLKVREGWLLVTRSGTTGVVSTVPRAWDGLAVSEHVIRIVPRLGGVDPAWLQAFLRSAAGRRALARGVFGSVVDEISPEFVAGLEIPVPEDRALLDRVVADVVRAESARQEAIAGLAAAVAAVEGASAG